MKIYNKKNFFFGLFMVLLLTGEFVFESRSGISALRACTLLIWVAVSGRFIVRSFSKECSKRDIIVERDERNRHIRLQAGRLALRITQAACFILSVALLLRSSGDDSLLTAGLCFFAVFAFSYLAELGATLWYERRS